MTDLLLLASLLDGPQHGYALKKRLGTITGHGPLHNNVVYPLLKRFVAATWVSRRKAQGQRGQTRELYSLTPKGKQVLLSRLRDFSEKDAVSGDAFRLRIGLFAVLSPEFSSRRICAPVFGAINSATPAPTSAPASAPSKNMLLLESCSSHRAITTSPSARSAQIPPSVPSVP